MDQGERKFPRNPRVGANILSVAVFAWVWPTFWKGYRKELDVEDLYEPLKSDESGRLGDILETHWKAQCEKPKPSLLKALRNMFWKQYLSVGLLDAFNTICVRLGQSLLLQQLLPFFALGSTTPVESAMYYSGGIVGCTLLNVILTNHINYWCMHLGLKMRIACSSLIFRKAMRLSRTALGESASGQVVNLLSNDVSRFDLMSILLNHLWIDPTLTVVVTCLMYKDVGWAAFVGVGTIFIIVTSLSYISSLSSKFRLMVALRTDKRIRLMDEIVNGVQVIKMYAWEKPFMALISNTRRKEIRKLWNIGMVRGFYMGSMMITTRLALFATLITYVLTGSHLQASFVFVIQSYYNILINTMAGYFTRAVSEVSESYISIGRLQKFLEYEEYDAQGVKMLTSDPSPEGKTAKAVEANGDVALTSLSQSSIPSDDTLLQFNDVNAKWNLGKSEETLRNINVRVSRGQLLAVIGPVGAGKSSLLQSVLGELATTAGRLDVRGKVSYACQEPWLFSGSVRQNITFGAPLDRKRYDEVVKACALLPDFAQLPFGDLTIVGERGSSLSGGQRARVNLARAVYREADIYLLDDPLSAVDTHVGKHLFEDCIVKFLAGKTRVLVTHQVQYLSEVSHIAILENGEIKAQGTFKELVNSDTDFAKILHLEEEDEEGDENGEFESADNKFSRIRRRLSRQMSAQSSASLASRGSRGSRRSRASSIQSIRSIRSIEEEQEVKEKDAPRVEHIEATSRGKVKGSMLFAYLLSGANVLGVAVTAAMFLAAQAAGSGVDYFVGFWTNQEELRTLGAANGSETSDGRQPLTTTTNFVYIYSAIIGFLLLVTLVRTVAYFWICSRCSQALHDLMFSNVIRATMLFFNTNPSGRILNRFSKDLGSIDEALPKTLLDAVQCVLYYFGYIFVAVSVNWILIVPVVILLVVFYLTRIIYLSSAKNIKRLEGMTRSPIFTHLNATIQGLSTIRAFSAQNLVKAEFDNHQNLNTGAYHMIIFTVVSFGNILDLLSAGFIAVVIFSFVVLEQSASGGDVGLAITQCLAMTAVVQAAIRQSAEVASLLLGVERVLEYANLPSEDDTHKSKGVVPNRDWPSEGCLVLKDVWLRYSPVGPPVLKGLNFTIKSTEKVGIVGRTGAGKSSLISALFRLAYMEGVVELDGVDTASMQLELLRSRISIIPQDPVLFSGTLRRNLDPFEEYRDDQLWAVLEDVELRDVAAGAEGLQMRVADAGSNYSVGQRQLICLARAILRGNKLLMLDEATANVDPQTDALIQKTIRSKFAHCTVLTVAHRLNTIMDSDRVLVMDDGRAAEFDHPHLLIQKRGIFYSLVQQTGQQMADSLARIARENYESKT